MNGTQYGHLLQHRAVNNDTEPKIDRVVNNILRSQVYVIIKSSSLSHMCKSSLSCRSGLHEEEKVTSLV